ncbi:MAG: epoxide hydrolase family protein [Actinophytocola sp.]|uniref:epoxide hydrolase family protein n=1 Tax=Actinophytocola sp. TaxID=1872138 RepID=UPI003D6A7EC4
MNIEKFRVDVPQAELDDLHARLAATRWPTAMTGVGWERGVPVDYLRDLAEHWRTRFDWRAQERWLNSFPQFTTTVDGQRLHFVHVRSANSGALPLLLTHGWPSSFVELLGLVEPLTDDFHLVIPSLPGFGFATPMTEPGWGNLFRVAGAFAELMTELGYERFGAHGGDIGAGVTGMLPMVAPGRVVAAHVTGPGPYPFGPPVPIAGLSDVDKVRAERFNTFQEEGLGYLHLQATRPTTLAFSLNDSPAGQLAWIAEKFAAWTDPAKPEPQDAVDVDRLLTNVSVYWFTGSGASSAQFGFEGMQAFKAFVGETGAAPLNAGGVPLGVSVFAADHSIRWLLDPDGAVSTWTEHDRGGHFPAMETPDLLAADLRGFFRDHR